MQIPQGPVGVRDCKFCSIEMAVDGSGNLPTPIPVLALQIQGEKQGAARAAASVQYRGVLGTILTMVRTEGPRSLYNGLVAGLQRQMSFASVRIGLYDSVKQFYTKGSERKCGAGPRLLGLFFSVMIAPSTFCCVAPLGLKIPRRIRGRENWQSPDSPNDNRALGLCQL